jgi:hypothetical protein
MKDAMNKLFLTAKLPEKFLAWYNDDNALASVQPKITITESQLYINKPKFEAIFHFLTLYSRQQSDREVPQTPFRNGVTDLTRLNGQEHPGLVMLTIIALKGLLHEKVPHNLHDDIVHVSWLMLVLNEMMNRTETITSYLELMHDRIVEFLALYKKVFGPTAAAYSITGLQKIKFHAPKHEAFYIKRYGSSDTFLEGTWRVH